ncbi:hypothetical protein [Lysobacter sp. HA35]
MQDNVYAPPMAAVADTRATDAATGTPFFVVAPYKLVLMYVMTLGLYRYYWSYMQWTRFRRATGTPMWPVARALFSLFYVHELNNEVDHRARRVATVHWSPGNTTTLYVVFAITSVVADRMSSNHFGPPWLPLVSLAALVPLAWSLWRTQCIANIACGDPRGTANRRLTWANWIWLALGVVTWVLVVIGTVGLVAEAAR